MKHRPRPLEQDDLLRPRLVDLIDLRHELVKLAALIDWEVFDREWAGFFPSGKGRPATEPRLVAGLLYLQHAYRLSDEAVVARWVEKRVQFGLNRLRDQIARALAQQIRQRVR
jgi:IS5 family transposase